MPPSKPKTSNAESKSPPAAHTWESLLEALRRDRAKIAEGGGPKAIDRQHEKNRLTARERIARLIDPDSSFFEFGRFAAWEMYGQWGPAPAASVICGIGIVAGRRHMIIANDATVKAGAFFPMTAKKVLRAQRIAMQNRLPLIYLVDSAGVFLPLQEDVFPDEDDFGRIFRNNAVISALGVPQIAAIMGNCVAGGGYLPVLCDKLLMTEGSGLYLAGPALVKSAIGQEVSTRSWAGPKMHARSAARSTTAIRTTTLPRRVAAPGRQSLPHRSAGGRRFAAPRRRSGQAARGDLSASSPPIRRRRYEVRDSRRASSMPTASRNTRPNTARPWSAATPGWAGFAVGIVANQHHRGEAAARGAAVRRRDLSRQRGQGGPLRHELQPDVAAAHLSARRVRLHGGPRLGAVGDHSGRGEGGQRDQQQPRAQADGDFGRQLRGRQLCHVRQGVRPAVRSSPGRRPSTP